LLLVKINPSKRTALYYKEQSINLYLFLQIKGNNFEINEAKIQEKLPFFCHFERCYVYTKCEITKRGQNC
jgi:hypothetical protein